MTTEWLASSIRIKFLILCTTVALIVILMPRGEAIENEISVGSVWIEDELNAEFTFEVLKEVGEYRREVEKKVKAVLPVFVMERNIAQIVQDSIQRFHLSLISELDNAINEKKESGENNLSLSAESFLLAKSLRQKEYTVRRPEDYLKELKSGSLQKLTSWYQTGILDSRKMIERDSFILLKGNVEVVEDVKKYETVLELRDKLLKNNIVFRSPYDKLITEYALRMLTPNVVYNDKITKDELNKAREHVSRYAGIVNEGERIIGKHDRISPDSKLKIESYRFKKGERTEKINLIFQFFGKFLHVLTLLTLFGIYLFLFRQKIFRNNLTLALFALMLLWVCFLAYLQNILHLSPATRFFVFLPAASMLITIIFDSRVGFYSTVIFSLVLGGLIGNDYTYVVMNIVAGAFAVYTVRDIKNRTQIFRSFLFILLGYSVTIVAFGLERYAPYDKIILELGIAGINSLISPVLTYGLLIFFEKIFKITTDLTLLELSNFDRPLLRDLALKAPGTFNHSVSVGNLAEGAANAIRANSLQARVGAYYHDIGKMLVPKYFVENQVEGGNMHDELPPIESARAIKEHVNRGIELAKLHNLPLEIIDFIPMHHGQTIMTYFYEKAKTFYGEENVVMTDYRYPGPKPNTKETAIVMLADSCESAVKSISVPDPARVENLISHLIESRINDGQLDECPLTFGDILKIKASFIAALIGQQYTRIRYPKQEAMESKDE